MPYNFFLLAIGGLVSGGLAGMLGIGGGIILVPLMLALGYSPVQAIATSSLVILISATSGSLQNFMMGYFDIEKVLALGIPSLLTAQLGVYLAHSIPAHTILIMFAALMIVNIFLLQLKRKLSNRSDSEILARPKAKQTILRSLIGAVAGLLAGLFGMGGGIVLVPFQILLLNETPKIAVQTSLGVIIGTAASACVGHAGHGSVMIEEGMVLGVGGIIGTQFSTRLLPKLSDKVVVASFQILLSILSVYMLWQAVY
jgi:uncharacterized protein